MTHPAASMTTSISEAVVIKSGEPFFLCPQDGQIEVDGRHGYGLYHHDTRFLSGYVLSVAGVRPTSLAAGAASGDHATLALTNPGMLVRDREWLDEDRLGIRWDRVLEADGPVLHDTVTIRGFGRTSVRIRVGIRLSARFEDVFEIRGLLDQRPGTLEPPRWEDDALCFAYAGRDGVRRTATVSFRPAPTERRDDGCDIELDVPSRGDATIEVRVRIGEELAPRARPIERRAREARRPRSRSALHLEPEAGLPWAGGGRWQAAVRSTDLLLDALLARSLEDLEVLRGELDGRAYYAAGVPWFSTLFGRDSLISAYQTLAFDPTTAADTLRLLAGRQGTKDDAWRDEAPGKILHELRIGELARLDRIPQTPYYGTVDATPLFLLVLAAHARRTGSLDLFHDLRRNVDRALAWIDRSMDRFGGYVAYDSASRRGLVNQGWKDSGDGIVGADGEIPKPPIALPEVQSYVHRAWLGLADLFERDGAGSRADDLRRRAADLRRRFEADFWSDHLGCYVLALDGDRRPCEVVASNAGQVLLSGLPSEERAAAVSRRLMADDAFSGWGVRTLVTSAVAYNPIGYHLGTVWPHDNSLIAEGFRRHGHDDAAERIFTALVEASADFWQQRLPECFAGFDRDSFGIPVRYPVACHPQAWAAGSIPHLLATTLGLEPDGFERRLRVVRPRLPGFVDRLELRDMAVAGGRVDLTFTRQGDATTVDVTRATNGIDVAVAPAAEPRRVG